MHVKLEDSNMLYFDCFSFKCFKTLLYYIKKGDGISKRFSYLRKFREHLSLSKFGLYILASITPGLNILSVKIIHPAITVCHHNGQVNGKK